MTTDQPAPYTDADVELVATATEQHHIVDDRTDAMGNSPCVCDQWWDAAGDNPSWDQHLAEVALTALAAAGRLAPTTAADGEPIPTTEEAFSWRDQLDAADKAGQRLQAELHAARRAAQDLLTKEALCSGSGREGHLNEDDLKPLFAALRIEVRP